MSANASPERRRRRWRLYAAVGVAVALGLGAGAWFLERGRAAAAAGGKELIVPPLITVIIPSRGEVTAAVSLTGLISARNDMPIGNEGDADRIAAAAKAGPAAAPADGGKYAVQGSDKDAIITNLQRDNARLNDVHGRQHAGVTRAGAR